MFRSAPSNYAIAVQLTGSCRPVSDSFTRNVVAEFGFISRAHKTIADVIYLISFTLVFSLRLSVTYDSIIATLMYAHNIVCVDTALNCCERATIEFMIHYCHHVILLCNYAVNCSLRYHEVSSSPSFSVLPCPPMSSQSGSSIHFWHSSFLHHLRIFFVILFYFWPSYLLISL